MDDQVALTLSRAALVAAVDAILHCILEDGFTDCHDLRTLTAECGSERCAADMELLRVAERHGVSITERLAAIHATSTATE